MRVNETFIKVNLNMLFHIIEVIAGEFFDCEILDLSSESAKDCQVCVLDSSIYHPSIQSVLLHVGSASHSADLPHSSGY